MNAPQNKAPPHKVRLSSPEEQAWLSEIIRQLAYDEYMQRKREQWLWERPQKRTE